MTRLLRLIVLGAGVAAATVYAGWWTVPIIGAVGARVFPRTPVWTAAAGAALGWAGLLGWTAWQAPVTPLAHRLAGVLNLPSWGLVALTLLFPALLAAAAARAVRPAPLR